jgi:hypothetical protein
MVNKDHVDGKSSCMPGAASNVNEVIIEEDEEVDEMLATPIVWHVGLQSAHS